jgi:hypothetical protein
MQRMQSDKYHHKKLHCFLFTEFPLLFHQRVKVSIRCKLSNDAELFLFVNELLNILKNKKIIHFFQNLQFPLVTHLVKCGHVFIRNLKDLSGIYLFCVSSLDFVDSSIGALPELIFVSDLDLISLLSG